MQKVATASIPAGQPPWPGASWVCPALGSRSTAGSGLGLALVRAVADLHGGTAIASGAAVRLRLPRQSPAHSSSRASSSDT